VIATMAKIYEHQYHPLTPYGNVISLLRDAAPKAGVHLDIACGMGLSRKPIRDELGLTYIGFDLAEDGLIRCARGFRCPPDRSV